MPAAQRVIIDTDGGIDDAVAIALALRSPEVSVCAITTTYGNNTVFAATRNVRALLDRAGRRAVPVLAGARTPMNGLPIPTRMTHGSSGLGDTRVPPLPRHVVSQPTALARAVLSVPWPVTLVTIGPFTNLAWALDVASREVRHRVRRHVALGNPSRDRAGLAAESDFNASVDPDATLEVLESGLHTTAIPVGVAREVALTTGEVEAIARSSDPLTAWLCPALRYRVAQHRLSGGMTGCTLPDVAAIAAVIARDVVSVESADANSDLDGDNGGDHREGRSTGRYFGTAFALDGRRVRDLLSRVFGTTWRQRKDEME